MGARARAPVLAAGASAAAILVAIVTGVAVVRHDAGSSLPDTPLPFGEWWPGLAGPAAHAFRHRVTAVVALVATAACVSIRRGRGRGLAIGALAVLASSAALAWHVAPLSPTPVEGVAHAGAALAALAAMGWLAASAGGGLGRFDAAWAFVLVVVIADALLAAWCRRVDVSAAPGLLGALAVVATVARTSRRCGRPLRLGLVTAAVLLLLRRVAVEWSTWAAPLQLDLPVSAVLVLATTWCAARTGATMDPAV